MENQNKDDTDKKHPGGKEFLIPFLRAFNRFAIPALLLVALFLFFANVPLAYILGYIILLMITYSIVAIGSADPESQDLKREGSHLFLLFALNALLFAVTFTTLRKYGMQRHAAQSILLVLLIFNILFFEIRYRFLVRKLEQLLRFPTVSVSAAWVLRTSALFVFILCISLVIGEYSAEPQKQTGKSQSEITGMISTVAPDQQDIGTGVYSNSVLQVPEGFSLNRFLDIGAKGDDVKSLQQLLADNGSYSGKITGIYDRRTALALNDLLRLNTNSSFTLLPFGPQKKALLDTLTSDTFSLTGTDSPPVEGPKSEATGTISTISGSGSSPTLPTPEIPKNTATATIEKDRIVVQVGPSSSGSESASGSLPPDVWTIRTKTDDASAQGGFYGVVMAAPTPDLPAGAQTGYREITFTADKSSSIFITIDGTDPNCRGKGYSTSRSISKKITVKAIACYMRNRVAGPVGTYEYEIRK